MVYNQYRFTIVNCPSTQRFYDQSCYVINSKPNDKQLTYQLFASKIDALQY
jgi:hypothetical protein